MQIVTSFSSSVTFHLLTLHLFPPLPISMSKQLLLPTSVFYPPVIFNLLLIIVTSALPSIPLSFLSTRRPGDIDNVSIEGVQQIYCYAALTCNYA